jgi:hypothetical protein
MNSTNRCCWSKISRHAELWSRRSWSSGRGLVVVLVEHLEGDVVPFVVELAREHPPDLRSVLARMPALRRVVVGGCLDHRVDLRRLLAALEVDGVEHPPAPAAGFLDVDLGRMR